MQKGHKIRFPYSYFQQFCVRIPLFSVDFFYQMTQEEEVSDSFLLKQTKNPIVKEAIFLASPYFYSQVTKWSRGEVLDEKKISRIKNSLIKYLTRMSTRCTPFGLFAGCTIGHFKEQARLELDGLDNYSRRTRYDMHFLASFSDYISKNKNIQRQIRFFPNTTLYRMGDYYRYVEYSYVDKVRQHTLESVLFNTHLENILLKAATGITSEELVDYLILEDFSIDVARNFIQELVDNQIILSELELCVTGEESLQQLKLKLENLEGTEKQLTLIEGMQLQLKLLDNKLGNEIDSYYKIDSLVKSLNIPYDVKYLFQTDVFPKFNNAILDQDILKKVSEGVSILNKISTKKINPNLEAFKTAFNQRFGQKKMSLLTVLDVETGIGYVQNPSNLESTPFLDDIDIMKKDTSFGKKEYTQLQSILIGKLTSCLSKNEQSIELFEEDFLNFENDWRDTSDTIATLIEIIVENNTEKIVMNHFDSGAAKLLGRFSYGNDQLLSLVDSITRSEEGFHENTILAEITHLPESRTGNILRRPNLRAYEIPCLGKSSLPLKNQIPLSDLLIGVEFNTITLYSKKHKKKVLPRLTNAHNYKSKALPIYHFLCDLQYQGKKDFGFHWGRLFNNCIYFPRVIYKDIILSKAIWNLKSKHIESLMRTCKEGDIEIEKVNSWRESIQLPSVVQIVDGDNTLPINFINKTSVLIFLEFAKRKKNIVLEEFLFKKECLIHRDKENYCNQFVVSLYKRK
jgi:hypothetical protein